MLIYQPSNFSGKLPPDSAFLTLPFSGAPSLLFSGSGVFAETAIGYSESKVKHMAVLVGNFGQLCHEVSLFLSGPHAHSRRETVARSTSQHPLPVLAPPIAQLTGCYSSFFKRAGLPLQPSAACPPRWEACCLWCPKTGGPRRSPDATKKRQESLTHIGSAYCELCLS